MPDNEFIEIEISKIIQAEKWKIIRLLTKVWEFPSYVPCVKESSVILKKRHVMQTRWSIKLENIPIRWIEEDTLSLKENAIYFKAIEGDLEEFRGIWTFANLPEGTLVKLHISLKVGIPAINEFANEYVRKLITKNFEAILDAIERRLISTRYSSYRQGNIEKISGFGIIIHFYNYCHLEKGLLKLNPELKLPSRAFLQQLYQIAPSFKLCDIDSFTSKNKSSVKGSFVIATFIPDMLEQDQWAAYSKVIKACKIAEKKGVGIVTLANFSSMVPQKIDHKISDDIYVPVTTGNSFTVATVIESILKANMALQLNLSQSTLTIVGGTGDIGSACARILADRVKELIITGRNKEKLKNLHDELARKYKTKIIATTDNLAAVKAADIVIACANSSASFLNIDWFKPASIICDVGYPKNVCYYSSREDILIFSGGLVKSPTPIDFPIDLGLPAQDIIYSSYAEGIILALEKRYENYSPQDKNITPQKVEEIRQLGAKHGFEPADFYWSGKPITEDHIQKVRKINQLLGKNAEYKII
ncbi:MAG: SRPBCC family protein [Candidatus Omnitrophota bacterium]|nr:NAD(P)-binding domain-containing protein [Candidatus Omnitrophota bacterium]